MNVMMNNSLSVRGRLTKNELRRTGDPKLVAFLGSAFDQITDEGLLPYFISQAQADVLVHWYNYLRQEVPWRSYDEAVALITGSEGLRGYKHYTQDEIDRSILNFYADFLERSWRHAPAIIEDTTIQTDEADMSQPVASQSIGSQSVEETPKVKQGGAPILLCNYWALAEELLGREPNADNYDTLLKIEKRIPLEEKGLADPKKSMDAGIKSLRNGKYKNLQE